MKYSATHLATNILALPKHDLVVACGSTPCSYVMLNYIGCQTHLQLAVHKANL